jgi:hypothetical protein
MPIAPLSSTMPPAHNALAAPAAPDIDYERLKALGQRLGQDFLSYEKDRRIAEMQWMRNLRQFKGLYDPDIEAQLDKNRSKTYPKLTRVKCVSMLSRLMNLLFPTGEKNWGLAPSPVPNLSEEDLQTVLSALQMDPNKPIEDQMIESAIMEFARQRGKNLEKEIDDQLAELGGDRMVDYVALSRKVLMSGIIYGIGILKGPFSRPQRQRQWARTEAGMLVPQSVDVLRPQFEHITVWDYYPDMSAKFLHRLDGQFTRHVFTRQQVRELAERDDFFGDVILKYLKDHQKGNYKRRTYESELRAMGAQINVNDQDGRKYEVIVWDGMVSGHYLKAAGADISDDQLSDQIEAVVWMIENEVIKADINPWVMLDVEDRINTFHHFIFEEDDSSILGQGLPVIMRDSQMAVASSSRMVMDNGSVVCGPNLEVNTDLLRADQDITSIRPYKIWYREGTGQEATIPAVKNVQIESHIPELTSIITMFREFADQETFVSAATGGDMQKGPSEPFRTAAGASMLRGDAALPFKDVVRNFDLFTQSMMSSVVAFNKHFNPKPTIRGDFQIIARGSTSLIAKEVRGIAYDNLAQSLTPGEAKYINWYGMAKERFTVRDIDIGKVLVDEEQAKQIDAAESAKAAKQEAQMEELMRAEVRGALADAVKSLTQADKNAAAADANTYNTILGGLENGVSPRDVAHARAGGGAPPAVVSQSEGAGGAGSGGAAGGSARAD